YLKDSASISGGMAGTEMPTADSMKTADFLALLNGDTRAWVLDSDNLLGGYPILRIMTADSSTLTDITKESDPTKLAYIAGETFNTGGLVIWANYSDGTREKLTDYTISKTGPLALGDTSITVSGTHDGQNYSYTFDITVTSDGLASIAVTTQPTNLLYAQGECFDPAGMVVQATSASGAVTTLTTADYTLNPDSLTPLTAATTKITVSYTHDNQIVTADIPITVLNTAAPQAVDGVYQIASANDLLWFAN
ncbi:MAG: bacterial Ig-like domain-containing protein, partial [Dehalobacterium sp.]